MSVIVFRDGIVASDTRVALGGWLSPERCQKIWTTPWGVAGCVGTLAPIDLVREWTCTEGNEIPPKLDDETTIIEFREDGVFVTEEGGTYRQPIVGGFFAWGSGRGPAFGALYAGANARRAVEIAILLEPACGGDVIVLHLDGIND